MTTPATPLRRAFALLLFASLGACTLAPYQERLDAVTNTHARFAEAELTRLAVFFDFEPQLVQPEVLLSRVEGFLLDAKGYDVVSRRHLTRILEEHQLAVSDITEDPGRLGELTNVDGLVILDEGGGAFWTANPVLSLVSVSTGETVFTATYADPQNEYLFVTAGEYVDSVLRLLEALPERADA